MALGTVTAPHELRFDTGRICLDLLATTHPEERLGSVEVVCAWITGSGLVPAGTPLAHADGSWQAAFRELRGRLARLVRGRRPAPPRTPARSPASTSSPVPRRRRGRCRGTTGRWYGGWTGRPAARPCSR
ncbi:ABATE domain-containing protein [Streptomyces sp. INA 01156]